MRTITELKKELIIKFENGTHVLDLITRYSITKLTISSILKNKDEIKWVNIAKGVTVFAMNRLTEENEKYLLVWINEKQLVDDSVSKTLICYKAKQLSSK